MGSTHWVHFNMHVWDALILFIYSFASLLILSLLNSLFVELVGLSLWLSSGVSSSSCFQLAISIRPLPHSPTLARQWPCGPFIGQNCDFDGVCVEIMVKTIFVKGLLLKAQPSRPLIWTTSQREIFLGLFLCLKKPKKRLAMAVSLWV